MKAITGSLVLALVAGCSSVPSRSPTGAADLQALAGAFVRAQFSFDQQALDHLTAANFVEISPKGEVDERDKVLSFYAPDKKSEAPPYTIVDAKVRTTSGTAVITQTIKIGNDPRSLRLSQALTAAYVNGEWKLTSSQTTPIPPSPPSK
jgi:hypothetical protein